MQNATPLNVVLYVVFPYFAVGLAIVVTVMRYFNDRFSFSSLSSQFLENRRLFWGSVPWHYAITLILGAHLAAALFPSLWGDLISSEARLYVMEVTGIALAVVAILGLSLLILRRLRDARVRAVTTWMDWLLLALLLLQVILGFWIALFYRWGSDWYLHIAVPWLYSLITFNPQIQYVTALPWVVQHHFLNAFLIVLLLPFSRLVHLLSFPFTYWWRPYQVIIWNRHQKTDKT
ncbi:MAG: respiratory nitrate reductase subunit gamma [Anaerolineae bacterium]|nr:respiratory nitrate reductase subunit gamma [Anaerolineae bacterium]